MERVSNLTEAIEKGRKDPHNTTSFIFHTMSRVPLEDSLIRITTRRRR